MVSSQSMENDRWNTRIATYSEIILGIILSASKAKVLDRVIKSLWDSCPQFIHAVKQVQRDKKYKKSFLKRFNWPDLDGKTLTLKVEAESELDLADVTRVTGYDDDGNAYLLVVDRVFKMKCSICDERYRHAVAGVCIECVRKHWLDDKKEFIVPPEGVKL